MSNVPTWLRSKSPIEYLYQTYQLAIIIGRITHKASKKYKDTYGTILIKSCERALYHGRVIQNIYVTSEETLNNRLYENAQMRAEVDNIATYTYIWFEIIRTYDGLSKEDRLKFEKYENQIGDKCNEIIRMLDGLKRSDRDKFKNRCNTLISQ